MVAGGRGRRSDDRGGGHPEGHGLRNYRRTTGAEQNREIKDRVLQTLMVLSHDLRGPLTSLSAGLQLLVRGRYGPWMRMSFVH